MKTVFSTDVAYALLRAVSRLVSTLRFRAGVEQAFSRPCPHSCGHSWGAEPYASNPVLSTSRLLIVACCFLLVASAADTSAERGKHTIDQAVAALGGDRFLNMQDRVESGRAYSFYRDRLSGLSFAKIYTRYLIRPEPPVNAFLGIREREAFGKKEDSAVLLTETEGYNVTYRGAYPLSQDEYERFRESTLRNVFYILRQRLGEPGLTFEARNADVIDNQPVEIVDITDNDNRVVTVYFHFSTKLPVRQVTVRRDPHTNQPIEEVTRFNKYRGVAGGIMWPYEIERERNGEKIFEIFSDSVAIDKGLTDNLFTLPADKKILGPKTSGAKK
jgi:hypothetical protein